MASKTTNFCSCYCDYPNPNHKYCMDFIKIKDRDRICSKTHCIRRSAFPECVKCLNLKNCDIVWKIAHDKSLNVFICTDYEE